MNRQLILNTVLILIPCLAVAGFMVQQANVDTTAVTGFETKVPVQGITREIEILFPQVTGVQAGTLESVGEDGQLVSQTVVVLSLSEPLDEADTARLDQWLEAVYEGSCSVVCLPAQDAAGGA